MTGLAVWRERWLAIYRRQPVRLWSPLPCDDQCLYRLRQSTSKRPETGFALYGRIRGNRIAVSHSPDRKNNFYLARLTAVAEPAPRAGRRSPERLACQRRWSPSASCSPP
jgi:hypothetical protein